MGRARLESFDRWCLFVHAAVGELRPKTLRDFGVLQTRRDVGFKVICLASRRKGFSATRSINLAEIVPTNRSLTRE